MKVMHEKENLVIQLIPPRSYRPVPTVLGNVWAFFGVWSKLVEVLATFSNFCLSE